MGILKTTRRLVNTTGNVKCKTTKAILQSKRREDFNKNGCRNLKQLRNLNYTARPATYRKSSKIFLPEIYERLGLVFPFNNSILKKYSKSPGIVVMYGNLLYIVVGGGKLYIKLPSTIKSELKAYINNAGGRQIALMERAAGERRKIGAVATAAGRMAATVVNP